MSSGVNTVSSDPLGALTNQYQRPIFIPGALRAPTTNDVQPAGTQWLYLNAGSPLIYETTGAGVWTLNNASTSSLNTLTGDSGGAITPSSNNITLAGTANEITTTGSGSTITWTIPSTFIAPGSIASTTTLTAGSSLTVTTSATIGTTLGVTGTSTLAATTIVGAANINASGAAATIIATGGTGTLALGNATGNTTLTGGFSTLTAASTIVLGTSAQTGKISVGDSTAALTVDVLNGVAASAQTLNIASGTSATAAQIVNLLSGATPGASTTLNIMDGAGTAGTQTVNMLASGATRAGVVNISTGAAAHITTIGSSTSGNLTVLASPITSFPGPVYVYTGAGAPSAGLALHVGDLYINTTAASATTRMYIATAASTWTNVTCAG